MARKMIEKPKLYYLKWHDAMHNAHWFDRNGVEEWINGDDGWVEEVGWIIHEDEKQICMCSRMSNIGDSNYGALQKIPKTWVKIRKLIRI